MNKRLKISLFLFIFGLSCVDSHAFVISQEQGGKVATITGALCGVGASYYCGDFVFDALGGYFVIKPLVANAAKEAWAFGLRFVLDYYSPEYLLRQIESSVLTLDECLPDKQEQQEVLVDSLCQLEEIDAYLCSGPTNDPKMGHYYAGLLHKARLLAVEAEQKLKKALC